MQTETLTQIKKQIILLDKDSKKDLAEFLADELSDDNKCSSTLFTDEERQNQVEWLKKNREKYAGKYVALNGNNLVSAGKTLREAHEKAKDKGFSNSFVTLVYSEKDVPFGGW